MKWRFIDEQGNLLPAFRQAGLEQLDKGVLQVFQIPDRLGRMEGYFSRTG
jgi:hypothetical protein